MEILRKLVLSEAVRSELQLSKLDTRHKTQDTRFRIGQRGLEEIIARKCGRPERIRQRG